MECNSYGWIGSDGLQKLRFRPWAGELFWNRIIISCLIWLTDDHITLSGPLAQRSAAVLLKLSFMAVYWVRVDWWNPVRLGTAILYLCALMSGYILWFNGTTNDLLLLMFVMGFIGIRTPGVFAYILAAFVELVTIYLLYLVHDLGELTFLLGMVGVFGGTRGVYLHREALRISQIHLQQLEKANIELKEATLQSMNYAVLEERNRIARDLHDSLGHSLTSIIVQLQALKLMVQYDVNSAQQTIEQLVAVARDGLSDIRSSVHDLVDDRKTSGLVALKSLAAQVQAHSTLTCEFYASEAKSEWSSDTSVTLYRLLQEALTNAARHGQATHVGIRVCEQGGRVVMDVKDDGSFRSDSPLIPGFGMNGMSERCSRIGGFVQFLPRTPHGLHVHVEVPVIVEEHNREDHGGLFSGKHIYN